MATKRLTHYPNASANKSNKTPATKPFKVDVLWISCQSQVDRWGNKPTFAPVPGHHFDFPPLKSHNFSPLILSPKFNDGKSGRISFSF
jgi:hypothetical protein